MKLELKHLAPYLPYELKGIASFLKDTIFIVDGIVKNRIKGFTKEGNNVPIGCMLNEFNPILVPLKELSAYSNGIKHRGYRTDEDNFLNLISDIESGQCNYDLMQMCFEEHIDVFGLIKAGLAIDINTQRLCCSGGI